MSADRGGSLGYQPALDGLRAVAVVMVLCFHQGFSWMTGGYVGVSVFFTLSGFLITALLLAEHQARGRIDVGSFYLRRVKRLQPAGLAVIAAVVLAARAGWYPHATALRGQAVAATLQVANWHALFRHQSYADLVQGGAGPLDHYWSLAVEEQFYWVWPLVVIGVLAVARTARRRVAWFTGIAVVGIAAGPLIAGVWGADAAYWSTPARLGEILTGAALAMWCRARRASGRTLPARWRWLAVVGLGAVVAAAIWLPARGGPAYGGWLPACSLASVALIAGLQVRGPVRAVLSWPPLVILGGISYGVYLVHWPLFLLLDGQRLGFGGAPLFAVRCAATLATAAASYVAIERPVRRGRLRPRTVATGAFTGAVAVVLLGLSLPYLALVAAPDRAVAAQVSIPASSGSLAPLTRTATVPTVTAATLPAPTRAGPAVTAPTLPVQTLPRPAVTAPAVTVPASTPASASSTAGTTTGAAALVPTDVPASVPTTVLATPSRPVRVLVLGDSTAIALANGLAGWASDHRQLAQVDTLASIGCGVLRGGLSTGDDGRFRKNCDLVLGRQLDQELARHTPDVVVVLVSLPDATEHSWGSNGTLQPTAAGFTARLRTDYAWLTRRLLARPAVKVLYLLPAEPASWFIGNYETTLPSSNWDGQRAAIAAVHAAHPDRVLVADFGSWLLARERSGDRTWRTDGLHLDPVGARRVVDQFLAARVLDAALGAV